MVGTSIRPQRIVLPPRLSFTFSQTDSAPSTPSPHTPLPYAQPFTPEIAAQHDQNGLQLDKLVFAGIKRSRETTPGEKVLEVAWTEEELTIIDGVLLHPYRPLRTSYPPGELPPPEVIDELAGQVVRFAKTTEFDSDTSDEDAYEAGCGNWKRSWEVTRKKIFDVALAESKFGHELDRKSQRDSTSGSGGSRPGLRRMDSMDFLDERDDEDGDVGRTMRLSTSLQNSAKQEPVVVMPKMTRTVSDSGPAMITLTPASPELIKPKPRHGLRGRGVAPRPSLLQRGRSFTAEDLAAEADKSESISVVESPKAVTPPSKTTSPVKSGPKSIRTSSPIPRSQSYSSLIPVPSVKEKFLNHLPIGTPITSLELPPEIDTRPAVKKTPTGWSDSEDEGTIRVRAPKKIKGTNKVKALKMTELTSASVLGDGLRSPFEEKAGMGF